MSKSAGRLGKNEEKRRFEAEGFLAGLLLEVAEFIMDDFNKLLPCVFRLPGNSDCGSIADFGSIGFGTTSSSELQSAFETLLVGNTVGRLTDCGLRSFIERHLACVREVWIRSKGTDLSVISNDDLEIDDNVGEVLAGCRLGTNLKRLREESAW